MKYHQTLQGTSLMKLFKKPNTLKKVMQCLQRGGKTISFTSVIYVNLCIFYIAGQNLEHRLELSIVFLEVLDGGAENI